jgi:hypothetical protein
MDPYGISHPEIRKIRPQLFSFNQFHRIHLFLPFLSNFKMRIAECGIKTEIHVLET